MVLRNVGQMFWRRPLSCNLSDVCLTNRLVKWVSGRKTTEIKCQIIECLLSPTPTHFRYICVFLWLDSSFPFFHLFRSIQSLSHVRLFDTPWTAARQISLSITNSRSVPKLMCIQLVMPLTISSAVVSFFFHVQSFPASGPFPMSQFFTSGSQSVGVSASTSVLPMNTQVWFPLGWTGWISLQSMGLLRVFSNTTVQKHQFFGAQLSL